jgi:hypothetical protein
MAGLSTSSFVPSLRDNGNCMTFGKTVFSLLLLCCVAALSRDLLFIDFQISMALTSMDLDSPFFQE